MRAVLLLSLAFLGCTTDAADTATATATAAQPATSGGTVELRKLSAGAYAAAQPEAPQAIAVRSASEFATTWEQTIGGGTPPTVDFAKESVVILLAGSKPTGGWSVEPKGVRLNGMTLVVDAAVKSPPADAIVTQAFTSPYAVIAVSDKTFKDVSWKP